MFLIAVTDLQNVSQIQKFNRDTTVMKNIFGAKLIYKRDIYDIDIALIYCF